MALYKRGDIWHFDFTLKGQRYRGTTGFKAKKDAVSWLEAYQRDIKLGDSPRRETLTVGQAADQWFASRAAGLKSADDIAMRLKILFRHLDRNLPVNAIGAREVEAAMLSRRVERIRQSTEENPRFPSNATVNRDIIDTTLRPILNYAEDILEEEVKRIKWGKLKLKEPNARVRDFTPEEMAAWRAELPEWHRPLFDFIGRYGVRLDEAFFHPDRVHVEAFEIVLTDTKNGLDHPLTILEEDMPALAARKARSRAAGLDTIWCRETKEGLTPITYRGFQSASYLALRRAGIMNARPAHDLRHHAATTLHRETGSIKLVQELLNHQDVASSARYAHTNKADLRKALRHVYGTNGETKSKNDVESKGGRVT